ncbi:MAG: YkgJ family cysteine cluster protein, partial [Bacteroidia bacterium]|nr:YkgJ family cysteine cluster protein [Bacteroidia bacterium]
MMNIDQILKQAEAQKLQTQKFFDKLKKEKPSDLDQQFHQLHDKVFQKINCLDCANCCKTTGPLFTKRDIKVISKYLKLSETDFIAKYLRVDEDNDYVLQQVPCVFLAADNTCSIYAYRPNACREYP